MRRTVTTAAVLAGVLIAGSATASAAVAAPVPDHPVVVAAGGVAARADASPVAGYYGDLGRFTNPSSWTASGTFVVPAVTCTAKTTVGMFVALFLTGADTDGAGLEEGGYVAAACNGTTPVYHLNVSAQGGVDGGVDVATAPHDTVRVTFVATTTSETSTITDVTTGATGMQVGTGFAAIGGIQASVQGGNGHSVFPTFGAVAFSKVVGAGRALKTLPTQRFDATNAKGTVKLRAGAIDSTGKGFKVSYVGNFGGA